MFLWLLFVAASLTMNVAQSGLCPTIEQLEPCECNDTGVGLDLFCNDSPVGDIEPVLANVARTKVRIARMTLENVWLPNLTSNFLPGHGVITIAIRNCSTSSVDKNAFVGMETQLRSLDLAHNALESVPSHALEKLSKLVYLDLEKNRIQFIHAKAFEGLESLYELILNGNRMKLIDDAAFLGIGNEFEFLYLDDNELTAVPYLPLRNISSVGLIDLGGNRIASLVPEEFDAICNGYLKQISLANNSIRHIPAGLFKSMKRLRALDVSGNDIESIHPSAFEGIEDSLDFLFLHNNQLEEVPSAALKILRAVSTLKLSSNKIGEIRKDDFLFDGDGPLEITLTNASLVRLDPEAFIPLKDLAILLLGSNQLETAPRETFAPLLRRLEVLDLRDNPLHCDCKLFWFQDWLKLMAFQPFSLRYLIPTEIKCATPKEHQNIPLIEMPRDQFVCGNSTTKTSESCCYYTNTSNILELSFIYLLTAVLICTLFEYCCVISSVSSS